MSDPIDAAIKATAPQGAVQLQIITIASTGRAFGLPPNLTMVEGLEIAQFLTGGVLKGMVAQQAGPTLVTPQGAVKLRLA